jgi:hypothetical protein
VQIVCQWFVEDAAGAALPGFLGLSMSRAAAITFGM